MMATKQISIAILCDSGCDSHSRDEAHPLVAASIYIKVPGLAFHKTVKEPGYQLGDWTVTHVKSGYRVGPLFNTRRQCMEYIKQIRDLISWNRNENFVRANYKKLSQSNKNIILRRY